MSKKPKEQKKGLYKPGTLLKDIIPPTIKQPPREGKLVRPTEYTPSTTVVNPYQPQPDFEDWPGDEAALNFDFGLESQTGKCYTDPVNFPVPPSFRSKDSDIIFWRRARELVKNDVLEAPLSLTSLSSKSKLRRQKTGVEGQNNAGRLSISEESGGLGPYGNEDMEIKLFTVAERDETAEEAELRVKEQLEKQQQQKKKPPGKNEVIDTNPGKIKEVKLSNISMKEQVPAYSKWIASQLQVIKDRDIRDVNTKKPIWTKIYPQKEGVPVMNPSGRYWVKLHHMGKEKKIDIDDRVPVVYGDSLFARSVNGNEIWTYILSKALIKLTSSRWVDPKAKDIEVGDGSIIYALTGYVPETISIPSNLQDKWKSVSYALSDKKYNNGDKYITCFSMPGFKPSAPSNKIRSTKEFTVRSQNRKESVRTQGVVARGASVPKTPSDSGASEPPSASSQTGSPLKRKEQPSMTIVKSPRTEPPSSKRDDGLREKPTHLISGFAYALVDAFENENFNMAYALKRSENEIRLRTELGNMQKVSLNKMSREEKVEHRKIVKDLKERLALEDAKRRELVKIPAEHYKMIKIKSSVGGVSALNFCSFDQDDITLARKCMLNRLSKPPNYDLYDVKQEEKSVSSAQIESQKILPLDDFSRIENFKEPMKRSPGGAWLTDQDLEGCFQYLQVFHDPTRFKYKETQMINARQDEELVNFEDKEVIVIEAQHEEEEKEKDRDHPFGQSSFLYSFAATRPGNMAIDSKPTFILQKYDFNHFEVAQSYKALNQPHDSHCLTLENKNQIFRIQLTSPLSCYLWISSDMHYKMMSLAEFLCAYDGYNTKTQQIDYPIIEKNRYHLFYKGTINALNQQEKIFIKLKNAADSVMLRSIRIKLMELTDKDFTSDEAFQTGVVTLPFERSFYAYKSVPITLEAGKRYMIVIEGRMPETVNEGVLDFDLLSSSADVTLETVEQVEPLEYVDKYLPTKYGVLFSERIFANNEVQASFFARISDILGSGAGQQQAIQKGKKVETAQVEEKDIAEKRSIKLELLRDGELIAFAFGQNKVVLSNVTLYPTNNKDEPRSYLLQAKLDLREWPECKEENSGTANLHWTLKVCGSDTVGVIKDTIKEDNEKAIKKSWEDKEPGRAEKAKTARRKYLVLAKIRRGEHVEPEELNLANEPRQKKNKEEEQKKDAKGKPQPPKGKPAPPAKGAGKKEEAPVEEKKEERLLPKSKDHVMSEICSFLTHMEQPRLLEEAVDEDGPVVRTEEEQRELREKILLGREEIYGMTERNKQTTQKIKEILSGNKEKVLKDLQARRQEKKEKIVAIMKDREEFRKKDKEVKDKYRAVTALCKQEKPVLEEIVKAQNEYAGQVDAELLKILEKVRKNAYIGEKVDRMNTALLAYDVQTVTAVLDEFRSEEIEMDEELYVKAEEMIDLAEKNPTFIENKQKEAQKAMKGKKK